MISAISADALSLLLIKLHSLLAGGFITLCLLEPDDVTDVSKLCKGQSHFNLTQEAV